MPRSRGARRAPVRLPTPALANIGLPLHCVSLRSRVAALRRGGAAAPRTPCRATSALALARAAVRRSSLRAAGGVSYQTPVFFGNRAALSVVRRRAGLTVKPSAVRHSVCMVGRDPRPISHCGNYAQEAEPVKGFHSPTATACPWHLPLTDSTSCAWARYGISVVACRLRCAWRAFGGKLYLSITAALPYG